MQIFRLSFPDFDYNGEEEIITKQKNLKFKVYRLKWNEDVINPLPEPYQSCINDTDFLLTDMIRENIIRHFAEASKEFSLSYPSRIEMLPVFSHIKVVAHLLNESIKNIPVTDDSYKKQILFSHLFLADFWFRQDCRLQINSKWVEDLEDEIKNLKDFIGSTADKELPDSDIMKQISRDYQYRLTIIEEFEKNLNNYRRSFLRYSTYGKLPK